MKELLDRLEKNKIHISLAGDELKVKFNGSQLTDNDIKELKHNKASLIEYLKSLDIHKKFTTIPRAVSQLNYPLSPSQRRLWILSQFTEGNIAYNMPGAYVFEGVLDSTALSAAFSSLLERHEILRTVFRPDEQHEVRQYIIPSPFPGAGISYHDLRGDAGGAEQVRIAVNDDFILPFDLSGGPLIRAGLYQLTEDRFVFTYVMHHIISDGWSMDILIRELLQLYNAYSQGAENPLSPLRIQYRDYAFWQQQQLEGESLQAHRDYWLKQFEGELPILELPASHPRPSLKTYNGQTIYRSIGPEVLTSLKELSQGYGGTLFMGLLSAVKILLYRYTGQGDLIIGTPMAGREHVDLEDQIGFYINTLALRSRLEGSFSYHEVFDQVKEVTMDAYTHQIYPFDQLVEELNLQRDLSRNPLFDAQVIFKSTLAADQKEDIHLIDTKVSSYHELSYLKSIFDIVFNFVETDKGLGISITYNSDIYAAEMVTRLSDHFESLLTSILADQDQPIEKLEYLKAEEKDQLLKEFNASVIAYPEDRTIVDLFIEKTINIPDSIAVVFEQQKLTYFELNELSDRIAGYLQTSYQIGTDDLVAVMLDRSEKALIAILGILKAGGVYVPVDPEYPVTRKEFILKDTHAKVLITQTDYIFDLDYYQGDIFAIDVQLDTLDVHLKPSGRVISPDHLAYVIYTSGSTGQPKGVMIEHRSILNTIYAQQSILGVVERERGLQFSSLSFDASVSEIFVSLISGGILYMISEAAKKDPEQLSAYLAENEIEIATLPPAYLRLLDIEKIRTLKKLITAGEQAIKDKAVLFNVHGTYYNAYGPTESSICATIYEVKPGEGIRSDVISIGQPIANTQVYILSSGDQLQPVGVTGEICLGGAGLARGYLNNQELSSLKFTAHPFVPGERIYRTGDLGKWLADGNIEFLGRADDQVKIRGYRIEPGEIERTLEGHEAIESAVVIAVKGSDGNNELVAYVVSGQLQESSALSSYLSAYLPGYMVPAQYIQLDALPLTINGKIDRSALPDPQGLGVKTGADYVAPRNETEERLVVIWEEVLGREGIGVLDDFFELGGHSLKATRLASQIHKELDVKLTLMDLFQKTRLKEQAQFITESKKAIYKEIKQADYKEFYPLSPAQKRLYFLQQFDIKSTSYNIPMVIYLGKTVDSNRLSNALNELVLRHESLRTSFEKIGDQVFQKIHTNFEISIEDDQCSIEELPNYLKTFIRPFNLNKAPLIRSVLLELDHKGYVWILDMHHIISDGTSHQILSSDFLHLYRGDKLPEILLQYKDFSEWQNDLIESGHLNAQRDFWQSIFVNKSPVLNLPSDHPRPGIFTFEGASERFILNRDITEKLRDYILKENGTLQMIMLAALNVVLYKYTSQDDIIVGCGIAGRRHTNLEGIVGMFVNSLPIRNYPKNDASFNDFFREVVSNCIAAYDNQDIQFEDMVSMVNVERDPSRNPLFDISLVVQNFDRFQMEGSGLTGVEDEDTSIEIPGMEYHSSTSKFDMTWFVYERDDDIIVDLEYYSAIYTKPSILRIISHFINILNDVLANPSTLLAEVNLLNTGQENDLLITFTGGPKIDYPADLTLHEVFTRRCFVNPGLIAVVDKDSSLTYRELDIRSNQMAHFLHDTLGLVKESRVGILLSRGSHLIISLLGVLKAGGAYVPLDSDYPEERLLYMLKDASIEILLTESSLIEQANRLQWRGRGISQLVCVDSEKIYTETGIQQNELMDKDLWDSVGEMSTNEISGGGWISSYTGEYLSKEEMEEYTENIYLKLKDHLHKDLKVLEIGCSSGLTMFRLAAEVGSYYGTDLSSSILDKTALAVQSKGYDNITLACMPAHEIDQLQEEDFDLVIINSVIQAFNGHNYLRDVLHKVKGKMKATGLIFLGDLMDENRRENLISDMAAFKQAHQAEGYRTKTDWSKELFISSAYLEDLVADSDGIVEVSLSDKIHSLENELTRYRYDALLKVNKTQAAVPGKRNKYQYDLDTIREAPESAPGFKVESTDLAYVIYTSGSTGQPKGVMIEHRAILNTIYAQQSIFGVTEGQRGLQFSSPSFDASVWEIFLMLSSGGSLYMISEAAKKDPEQLSAYLAENEIEIATLPPAYLRLLDIEKIRTLKKLITAGEQAIKDKAVLFNVHGTYYNAYGPTESSICATIYEVKPGEGIQSDVISIGRPIANTQVYILGAGDQLQPVGVTGEICLGGAGLARGYLNNQELSSLKFTAHPFVPGERIYRTGDLGKWLADGNIEFLGRADDQVKIRGYRIEPGEIERTLEGHEAIESAVVIAVKGSDGNNELVAYVVSGQLQESSALSSYLLAYLPGYMVPAQYIQLDAFPLTVNGKIDKTALPDPNGQSIKTGADYVAPRNGTEERLVSIWQEILGREGIGVKDNFFDLGGNSVKIIRLSTQIRNLLNIDLKVSSLFQYPTIQDIANHILNETVKYEDDEKIDLEELVGDLNKFGEDDN